MKRPTEILSDEHRIIEGVLDGLTAFAARAGNGAAADDGEDRRLLGRYAEFFRTFADQCHHGKEEELLFRAMEAQGMPAACSPTAVMRQEHEEGRLHVRALTRLAEGDGPLTAAERARLRETAGEYAGLLRAHIEKEDGILFPMADRLLDGETTGRLAAAFDHFECSHMGHGVHERLHELALSLMEGARR
ncbi:MAG: hemerythrin domain-containing protein [Candidatus Krumholzibacteriia bacterium]